MANLQGRLKAGWPQGAPQDWLSHMEPYSKTETGMVPTADTEGRNSI
jgi:hypothetical protein